jgi:hypothetical protein
VYTIVFFEKSTSEFKEFPVDYVHHFEQRSNTGIEIDLLQKYIFIPLDVFRERKHNKIIKDDLEAWLTFFSTDNPEEILHLTECYPRFAPNRRCGAYARAHRAKRDFNACAL